MSCDAGAPSAELAKADSTSLTFGLGRTGDGSLAITVVTPEGLELTVASLQARIKQLEERLEGMREAGDQLWYCVRHAQRIHADELIEAIEDWQEARNHG